MKDDEETTVEPDIPADETETNEPPKVWTIGDLDYYTD